MYIGIAMLNKLLNDDKDVINWFSVSSINEHKSEIELSYGDKFTTNTSIEELFDMIKSSKNYSLPSAEEFVYKFYAINQCNITDITDEHIVFENNATCENFYENANILIDTYELSLNIQHCNSVNEK